MLSLTVTLFGRCAPTSPNVRAALVSPWVSGVTSWKAPHSTFWPGMPSMRNASDDAAAPQSWKFRKRMGGGFAGGAELVQEKLIALAMLTPTSAGNGSVPPIEYLLVPALLKIQAS